MIGMRTGTVFLAALLAAIQLSAQKPQLLKNIGADVEHGLPEFPYDGFGGHTLPIIFNNRMYFAAANTPENTELWSTDGTAEGTIQVAEIHPNGASRPANLFVYQNRLYFSADNGTGIGSELFVSDGTGPGTALLKDVVPGMTGSNARNFYVYNNTLYFEAFYYTEDPATRLHQSDGTPEGTDSVHFPVMGYGIYHTGAYFQAPAIIIKGKAVIGNAYGGMVACTDLSTGQSTILRPGLHNGLREFTELLPDSLFVFLSDSADYSVLWRSNGTPEGTYSIGALQCLHGNPFTKYNNALYYWVYGCSAPETEGLWKTDGTAEGTVLVKPAASSNIHYDKTHIVLFKGLMYFVSRDSAGQTALWHSDGTPENTRPFFTFDNDVNHTIGASLFNAVIFNDRLFFTAYDQESGWEIWSTDGTAAGTALLYDLNPGAQSAVTPLNSTVFFAFNDKLFFQVDNGATGKEWFYIEESVSHVEDPFLPEASVIYPNPSGDFIRISDTGTDIERLTITSSIGEEVYSDGNYEDGKTIDIRALPTGVYIVRIGLRGGEHLTRKLIRR